MKTLNKNKIIAMTMKTEEIKNNLVEALGQKPIWVNWNYEKLDDDRTVKLPLTPNGRTASVSDPKSWATYQEVKKSVDSNIGIVFTPEKKLLGVDLDHCLKDREVIGNYKETVERLLKQANTYTEVSPSGTGLHLYFLLDEPLDLVANRKDIFEVYTSGRYFTVTEDPYVDMPVREISKEEAINLLKIIGYPWNKKELDGEIMLSASNELMDLEVLCNMFDSKNGKKIESLYEGDISEYSGDDSSADMAFCTHLAYWTNCNKEQIERIWLFSPLGRRDKTIKRKDYRDMTIDKAIEYQSDFIVDIIEEEKETDIEKEIKVMRISDILKKEFKQEEWRIKDLIPNEGFTIISSPSGEKKTWLALEIAKAISEGTDFLGQETFKTNKGCVLYINGENSDREIKRRISKLRLKSEDFLVINSETLNLNNDKNIKQITRIINENRVNVIIIDTFRALAGGINEDRAEEIRSLFNKLKFFKDMGISLIFLDHNRKPQNFEGNKPKKEQLLGSQDKTANMEVLIQISSPNGSNEIKVYQLKNRLGREIEPFIIRLNESPLDETMELCYDGPIYSDRISKKEEAKYKVVEFLGSVNEPMSIEKITKVLKDNGESNLRSALKELVKDKQILKQKEGHRDVYSKNTEGDDGETS